MCHHDPPPAAEPDPADRLADDMLDFLRGGPLPDPVADPVAAAGPTAGPPPAAGVAPARPG